MEVIVKLCTNIVHLQRSWTYILHCRPMYFHVLYEQTEYFGIFFVNQRSHIWQIIGINWKNAAPCHVAYDISKGFFVITFGRVRSLVETSAVFTGVSCETNQENQENDWQKSVVYFDSLSLLLFRLSFASVYQIQTGLWRRCEWTVICRIQLNSIWSQPNSGSLSSGGPFGISEVSPCMTQFYPAYHHSRKRALQIKLIIIEIVHVHAKGR